MNRRRIVRGSEGDMKTEIIYLICYAFILTDWIYMKVKYGEWSTRFTLCVVATALFVTAAMHWKG